MMLVFQQLNLNFLSPFDRTNPNSPSLSTLSFSYPTSNLLRLRCASSSSSSASLTGSASEQWPLPQRKHKIAGIDQDQLSDPLHLADPDSCFCDFNGVQIHHKLYTPPPLQQSSHQHHNTATLPPIILLHGFGASVFSWNRVMKRLAETLSSKVVAFDRPAFGLTSRLHSNTNTNDAKPLNPYSMAFSVLASLYFIDFLSSDKAILVGHSAGSLVAVNAYFEAPERVAALILVAPAIIAPRAAHKVSGNNSAGRDIGSEAYRSNSNIFNQNFTKILVILSKCAALIIRAIMQMIEGMAEMLNSWYKKALSAILRSAFGVMLIRLIIDKFGIAAVRMAWYDTNQVTEHVLDGYTKPLKAKDWDKALAEFTAETLASSVSDSKPPISKRLHEISCPVLIVTGDTDRIVPVWNSKRLSQAIPGSCLEVIKHCGHLPQEEKAEEFVSIVEKFLQRVFSDSNEPSVQPAV